MTVTTPAPARVSIPPRSLERLEAEIVTLATQLTAATARFVALVGEFDAAEGWRDWAMRSTAHWLSWQCGVGMAAGREHVRVARALRELPVVAAAFAEGRLSYSKVRALSRFATADNEADVVAVAEAATAAQLEALGAGMRRARSADDVRRRHEARYFSTRYDDDGSLTATFRLPPEQAAVFMHGLEVARGRVAPMGSEGDDAPDPPAHGAPRQPAQSRTAADALVAMAERIVDDVSAETSGDAAERFQLVLHSSVEALAASDSADDDGPSSELADGTRLHPATARRLTCDCPSSTMIDGPDGAALHVGRRHRRIRGRLLRAVQARDRGRCRAPGCTQRATQIHHIRHWANGGPTCLANLISLCDHHHWTVHEGGFTILTRARGTWALLSPAGVTVDPTPGPTGDVDQLPTDSTLSDDAVSGLWDGTRLDVVYATSCLSGDVSAETPFDWDTINRWYDNVRVMSEDAPTGGHIVEVDDTEMT